MHLLSLLTVLACIPPAASEEVGAVMLVSGSASLRSASGAQRPVEVGAPVDRSDTVVTEEGALVVLHLRNEQLVRIDEDLSLAVARIVVLDAPPAPLNAQAQLAQLVDPRERTVIPGYAQAERVAGWHARLTAAEAPAATRSAPAAAAAPPPGGGGGAAPASAPPPPPVAAPAPAPPPAPKVAKPAPSKKVAPGAGPRLDRAPAAMAPAAMPPPPPPAPAEEAASADDAAPAALTAESLPSLFSGELGACMADWSAGLPVRLSTVDVIVRVEGDQITRVLFDGGLHAPACARDPLLGRDVQGVSGNKLTFTVTIP